MIEFMNTDKNKNKQTWKNLLYQKILLKQDMDFATFTPIHSARKEIETISSPFIAFP